MEDPIPVRRDAPYAMWVIIAGLSAMTLVTIAALVRYPSPTAIVTALGPVTGVIGTLVGAYFGLRGATLAQQHATAAEVARTRAAMPEPPSSNGHGTVVPNTTSADEEDALSELAAIDEPSDAGDTDIDLPDPEDVAVDTPPSDEGDDREAHGATR